MSLTRSQRDALRAADDGKLFRDERKYPHRHYIEGSATTVQPSTVSRLFDLDLIRPGERVGFQRPLLTTVAGKIALYA